MCINFRDGLFVSQSSGLRPHVGHVQPIFRRRSFGRSNLRSQLLQVNFVKKEREKSHFNRKYICWQKDSQSRVRKGFSKNCQWKTHPEKNWRKFWIAWNIGSITYSSKKIRKTQNHCLSKSDRCFFGVYTTSILI